VFAALFALSFLVARFAPLALAGVRCPARVLLGVPCATCGMTRAFAALARGDVAAAVGVSPAGALLAAGAWAFAAAAALRPALGFGWPRPSRRAARALAIAAGLALLVNWAYLLASGAAE
jgi:hypothetical protein